MRLVQINDGVAVNPEHVIAIEEYVKEVFVFMSYRIIYERYFPPVQLMEIKNYYVSKYDYQTTLRMLRGEDTK